MRIRLVLLLSFIALLASVMSAGEVPVTVDIEHREGPMSPGGLAYHREEIDALASVSHLPILKDGDPDELRVWYSWATFDPATGGVATTGYVFSGRGLRVCRIGYQGKATVPARAWCARRPVTVQRGKRIAEYLQRLSAFPDYFVDCGGSDGAWVAVDAVADGTRFLQWAGNPNRCKGDFSMLVSELIKEVNPQMSR